MHNRFIPEITVNIKRLRAEITGRVQGVGFRPTVCRLARTLALAGFVKNTPDGVLVEIQGPPEAVDAFCERLQADPPRQARIDSIRTEPLPPCEDTGRFDILPSVRSGDLRAGMPPDLATCADCRAELFAPTNRRHRHPFINCTNCGPRFTIIRALPYDRERTSMASFAMCPACRQEYLDPADRRFDAQPNACPVCGPEVALINRQSKHPPLLYSSASENKPADSEHSTANVQRRTSDNEHSHSHKHGEAAIREAVRILKTGGILAVKGLGGYHLCCDAANAEAIGRLRGRKHRPAKSLAVMFADLDQIRRHCEIGALEEQELTSPVAPILVARRKAGSGLPRSLSPDTEDLGVFLPYTPLHHLLLAEASPLVMTSGNLAEEPIAMDEQELNALVGPVADGALLHNRAIVRRSDDSVLKMVAGQRLLLRRSRGLVPDAIRLPLGGPPILACGADLKNTIGLTRGREAFLSQHIGDLEERRALNFFRETIADLSRLLQVRPAVIAHDLHPDYHSTRFALSPEAGDAAIPRLAVQHHHAHIAACLAEHGLTKPAIGVALDGTGYGPDGTIWGGEFLVADLQAYRRVAYFKPYPLPGGAEAIRHPERMAFSALLAENLPDAADLLLGLDSGQRNTLRAMLEQGLNSPLTSSAGRLFDIAAALLGVGDSISYEARGAIRLQTMADRTVADHYPFELIKNQNTHDLMISFGPMLQALVADLRAKTNHALLAGKFHNTIAAGVVAACRRIRETESLDQVALSGGVFQNDLLLNQVTKGLRRAGFRVYSHQAVPPNDGGIALGQAAVALQQLEPRN